MREPAFWWTEHSVAAALLAPVGACYGAIAARRMARPGCKAPMPIICVGNFILGGAGKTPTAMALARLLLESGRRPFFLSRGYGGQVAGPVRVDHSPAALPREARAIAYGAAGSSPSSLVAEGRGWGSGGSGTEVPQSSARSPQGGGEPKERRTTCGRPARERRRVGWEDVGDEPPLLARVAPTIVARDRLAGVTAAAEGGADTIIMDDGLQNPSLEKDLAIAVVDGRRGIGNGRVFPAGPLRAPLEAQFDHIDAVILVGSASRAAERAIAAAQRRGVPVFHGDLHPASDVVAALAGKPVLAFAGIADPEKFFATLEAHSIPAAVRKPFPDHHRYTAGEISALVACAERKGLTLLTTEKDLARLSGDPAAADLVVRSEALPVSLGFRDVSAVEAMLHKAIRSRRSPMPA